MSHCAFRFLLHQKHSLYVHHLLKKCVKILALIFFSNSACLFPKFVFVFCHTISVSVTPKTSFVRVHQLLKKFRENVRVDFLFQILGCFQSLFFVTHPATFCFCYKQKHSSYVHQLLIKFSVHTMLFSVSVTPTTFFTIFFCENTIR